MKNITLKIDDETYRKARMRAAQQDTSISAMVREFLQRGEDDESARETKRIQAMEALYAIADERGGSASAKPVKPMSREEIYETRLR